MTAFDRRSPTPAPPPHRDRGRSYALSVAPMMNRTDRHFRAFLRCLTRETLLYTEMVPTGAVLQGDRDRHLGFDPVERPLVLQLGGDDPEELARCAWIAEAWGYDEVNLNVGCPSDRVQKGNFGVCLMAEPETVAAAVAAMRQTTSLPVSVKHRIGFDELDGYGDMRRFVEVVAAAGCDRFSVHARKAWLSGLNPKENRNVPPLRPAEVHRLKRELPDLRIEINGGVRTLEQAREHLEHVDGVMIGRAAYDDPYLLARADSELFGQRATAGRPAPVPTRRQAIEAYLPYVEEQLGRGVALQHMTRHILQLFAHRPGARAWRRHLSENAHLPGAGAEVILAALEQVPDRVLDEGPGPEPSPEVAAGGTPETETRAVAP